MILIGKLSFEKPHMLKAVSCFSFLWSEKRSFNLKLHFLLKTFKKWNNNFNNSCKLEIIYMYYAHSTDHFATVNDHNQPIECWIGCASF